MDREAKLPLPPPANLVRPIPNQDTSSSTSSSSSPPGFIRDVQAAFKRHRSLGTIQTNGIMPRRMVVPQRAASRNMGANNDTNKSQDYGSLSHGQLVKDKINAGESQEDAFITPPSITGTTTKTFDENFNPFDVDRDQHKEVDAKKENNPIPLQDVQSQNADGQRKVQFLTGHNAVSQEMEWNTVNQVETSTVVNNESKHSHFQNLESEIVLKSDGGISSLAKRTTIVQDQIHHLRNFLGQPVTQSSVVGSSCATTTSIHSSSVPMLNLTTYCSRTQEERGSHVAKEPPGDSDVNCQLLNQGEILQQEFPSKKEMSRMLVDQAAQASTSGNNAQLEVNEFDLSKRQEGSLVTQNELSKDSFPQNDKSIKGQEIAGCVTNIQSQPPLSKDLNSNPKLEPSKAEKQGKATSSKGASAPRKRSYDPDLFFKVNGKLYQRLGKIGSGGSSEVHKVISSDCTIYALKKIKLKGRDYASAYGFCQEIEYLNRLKGKNNIINLIDYEVTDKNLLREVMNGCMSNKDGRVKDDGYLYMVLEYGEIDLAHMLSQKWKEMDNSNQTIDENWLRFYWQQILQAVNTIHEERIVHSDLKPANFLLVKGSLKLIDFGIAKAIMSDTTNIQRDSQVGTLSYMSPEAFMCNESDANGNTIKCGRPSDIWSLGCILYQMVYGRTPFADYKTFWSKFKVITDPNHEISYEPVSNPWLLDIMKKCLAWDRNKRWRIPELLQHPFLVPPVPPQPSLAQDQSCQLLELVAKACSNNQDASMLCSRLTWLLRDPMSQVTSESLTSREQQCKLLTQMSKLCFQLQEHLSQSGNFCELPVGTVCVADTQFKGRGRSKNAWESPRGCLMFSFTLQMEDGKTVPLVQYVVSLAVTEAIKDVCDRNGFPFINVRIKWPNDLYLNGLKVGGILCTSTYKSKKFNVSCGIGFNVGNEKPTTCLNTVLKELSTTPNEFRREDIMAAFFNKFEMLYDIFINQGFQTLEELYYRTWLHSGQRVIVQEKNEDRVVENVVTIQGLTSSGYLLAIGDDNQMCELHPDGNSFDFFKGLVRRKLE